MGEGKSVGLGRRTFGAIILTIVAVVLVQTVAHLTLVLGTDRIGTVVDLDRSNGAPDLVSTAVLAIAASAALAVAVGEPCPTWLVTAVLLALLTLADTLHDGAHPHSSWGPFVIGLVLVTVGLLALIATDASTPARWTLGVAMCFLACSFLIIGLDRVDHRFERERGDPTAEYQIVAKEGLELLGWSLVALALWDEALRRRRVARAVPTAPASRARAPSRRHAA